MGKGKINLEELLDGMFTAEYILHCDTFELLVGVMGKLPASLLLALGKHFDDDRDKITMFLGEAVLQAMEREEQRRTKL